MYSNAVKPDHGRAAKACSTEMKGYKTCLNKLNNKRLLIFFFLICIQCYYYYDLV
jgi:hypothetical protein